MTNEKKLELLEELFEAEAGELRPEILLEDLEGWDSITKLSLIVLMDDEFGKKLTSTEIKSFKSLQDIMNYMK